MSFEKTLASQIQLGRDHQQAVVSWALERLVGNGQVGVVLADEVGSGKTYEALAIMSLLWEYYNHSARPVRRILILCKPALLRKWNEELTTSSKNREHGFRSYLIGPKWEKFVTSFIENRTTIQNVTRANHLWGGRGGRRLRGRIERRRVNIPDGLYLVNTGVLHKKSRNKAKLLKYIFHSPWDLVIVDEAHHFGKGGECDSIFASPYKKLGRNGVPGFGVKGTLSFRHILLLTATPFELNSREMVNLLRIAQRGGDTREFENLLEEYQSSLEKLFELRALVPENPARVAIISQLHDCRTGTTKTHGLESLMRGFMARNSKSTIAGNRTRSHALVIRSSAIWDKKAFGKFDNLREMLPQLTLIPFEGPDSLFYLRLRELVQEAIDARGDGVDGRSAFVAMDLQQGLSSYHQLLKRSGSGEPKRLLERNSPRAKRLRKMLTSWETRRLHPKVAALADVVESLVRHEIDKVKSGSFGSMGKIVVFNKFVLGTAKHLNDVLLERVSPLFVEMVNGLVTVESGLDVEGLKALVRRICQNEIAAIKRTLDSEQSISTGLVISRERAKDAGFKTTRNKHLAELYRPFLEMRVNQPLFLISLLLHLQRERLAVSEDNIREFICENLLDQVCKRLLKIAKENCEFSTEPGSGRQFNDEGRITQELSLLRETLGSPRVVARYDGSVTEERESNRLNFNEPWNPFVLIVSRVGEEGIDLQKQSRYILHYDLEWNPAKMEQREGRVDREGYSHDGPIDVRFFLLKGTYEERIFHTVMQRDQWFQILMGDQKKKLGSIDEEESDESETDAGLLADAQRESWTGFSAVTSDEFAKITLDLTPR